MAMVVDNGATEHFLDNDLIPGLQGSVMNPAPLHVPKTTITAGNRNLVWKKTAALYGTFTDRTSKTHQTHCPR